MTDKAKSNRMALDNGQIEPALDTHSDAGHGIPSVNVAPLSIEKKLARELNDLLYEVGRVAFDAGEAWRLEHAELMDSFQAAQETLEEYVWGISNVD